MLIMFLNLSVLSVQYANTRLIRPILQLPPWITFSRGSKSVFFFYPVDKSPPLLCYLSQMNPINLLSPYFLRSLSVITLSYGLSSLIRTMASNLFSVIISHLFLRFLGGSFHLVYISFTFHLHRISIPSHSCWFDHSSDVQQRVKIINPFITEFSPFFCSFCYLTSICVPFPPILARCQPNQ